MIVPTHLMILRTLLAVQAAVNAVASTTNGVAEDDSTGWMWNAMQEKCCLQLSMFRPRLGRLT